MRAMGFTLPEDEIVGFVKPDPTSSGERDEVGFVDRMKGRMALEKVGDAV
jgi:hypothetical protein